MNRLMAGNLGMVALCSLFVPFVANSVNEDANPSKAEPTPAVMTATVTPGLGGSTVTSGGAVAAAMRNEEVGDTVKQKEEVK